jgi:hypothetical protein
MSVAQLLAAALLMVPGPTVVRGDSQIGTFHVRGGTLTGLSRAFGAPASLRRISTGCRGAWPRLGMEVDLYNLGTTGGPCKFFHHALLTGKRWRTANGLRIGDSLSRLQRLFPGVITHGSWRWLIPRSYIIGPYTYAGLSARVVSGRVVALRVEFPSGGD